MSVELYVESEVMREHREALYAIGRDRPATWIAVLPQGERMFVVRPYDWERDGLSSATRVQEGQ